MLRWYNVCCLCIFFILFSLLLLLFFFSSLPSPPAVCLLGLFFLSFSSLVCFLSRLHPPAVLFPTVDLQKKIETKYNWPTFNCFQYLITLSPRTAFSVRVWERKLHNSPFPSFPSIQTLGDGYVRAFCLLFRREGKGSRPQLACPPRNTLSSCPSQPITILFRHDTRGIKAHTKIFNKCKQN